MRSLTTIRQINALHPIPKADKIEVATVDGWEVVVKKGEFNVSDYAVYFEIDSFIPTELAPFLTPPNKAPRVYKGILGERLKTIRLRGQISQGLLLPLSVLSNKDLSESLGIIKYEKPLPTQLQGFAKSKFPSFIRKTDQERIQNIPEVLNNTVSTYEVSLKLDGSSITIFQTDDEFGVCSRNLQLKTDGSNKDSTFIKTTLTENLDELIKTIYLKEKFSVALQGELVGPGIQGNPNKLDRHKIYIFDIWDIDEQKYLSVDDRHTLCEKYNIRTVPTMYKHITLADLDIFKMSDILMFADATFDNFTSPIEGLVFKQSDGQSSFKVINNKYLLRAKD